MDQSDYLTFLPGRTVGHRLQWEPDSSPEAREITKLGQQVEGETDPAKAIALYQQIDRLLSTDGPYIPLYQPASLLITNGQLPDVAPGTPLEGPLDGAARWQLRP